MDQELDDRKKKILKAIIKTYMETGEPVGSRTISKFADLNVSSATIRNEMSDLTDMGYIVQPHTSAGRIPSDKGYRLYVDELMKEKESEVQEIKDLMIEKTDKLDKMLKQVAKVLASNTNYATMISVPQYSGSKIKFIQLSRVTPLQLVAVVVSDNNVIRNQIINLGKSLQARYREYLGLPFSLPEDGYHGEDVKEIAVSLAKAHQDAYAEETEENLAFFKQKGIEFELEKIRKDLDYYRVHFDVWSSEQAIRDAGKVEAALEVLKEKGLTYEKEGALWFETTRFGDDKDRVLRKTDGSYTYLVPDIAYHKDKMDRGYDLLVDFFGADHHGYVPRLKASIAALGNDPERLAVDIIQMVRLVENGQEVKMSKRLGNAVTIRELCDEVGVDAARYFFVQRALDTHLDFDLGLARSQSNDNPVYYAQYAHARMCSILRQAQDVPEASSYERLTHEKEADLMKYINEFTSVVSEAARLRAPHKVCNYIQKLAQKFHSFYNACKVIDREDMELSAQRLDLVKAARITLGNALELIGVEAPEKM